MIDMRRNLSEPSRILKPGGGYLGVRSGDLDSSRGRSSLPAIGADNDPCWGIERESS